MTIIAENPYYSLSYEISTNRFYLGLSNHWSNTGVVPNYMKDWEAALTLSKPGFTVITDARLSQPFPADVLELHEQAQRLLVKSKLKMVAEVLPESLFIEFQSNLIANNSSMPYLNKFRNVEEAENWLDENYPVTPSQHSTVVKQKEVKVKQ